MSSWFAEYGHTHLDDGIVVGAAPHDDHDVAVLRSLGVSRVLNLVEDREYPKRARRRVEEALAASEIVELRVPSVDFGHLGPETLDRATEALGAWVEDGRTVYVHCRAGRQRSAAVAAAFLAVHEGVPLLDALERIRRRRPEARPLPLQRDALADWWTRRGGAGTSRRR